MNYDPAHKFKLAFVERRKDGGLNTTRLTGETAAAVIADLIASEGGLRRDGKPVKRASNEDNTALLAKVILAMDAAGELMLGWRLPFVEAAENFLEGVK